MKYLYILLPISFFLFFAGCPRKEDSRSTEIPTEKVAVKETVNLELDSKITDEHFKEGMDVSSLSMVSLKTGEVVSLGSFKGKKIVIDFWASWCAPCIGMFPVFNELKRKMEDEAGKVKVVSINLDPLPAKAKKIMKNEGAEFEVLKAPESLINAGILMPFTVIADENGTVFVNTSGVHTYEELLNMIEGEKD